MNLELQNLIIESYKAKLDALALSSGLEKEVIEANLIAHLSNAKFETEAASTIIESAPTVAEDTPTSDIAERGIDVKLFDPVHREIDFDIKVFSIKGTIDFVSGKNWKANVKIKLHLIGIELEEREILLSPNNSYLNIGVDIGLAALVLQIGIRQGCLYVKGKAGLIVMTTFDQNIVCF